MLQRIFDKYRSRQMDESAVFKKNFSLLKKEVESIVKRTDLSNDEKEELISKEHIKFEMKLKPHLEVPLLRR